jgi:hypothetical protein
LGAAVGVGSVLVLLVVGMAMAAAVTSMVHVMLFAGALA